VRKSARAVLIKLKPLYAQPQASFPPVTALLRLGGQANQSHSASLDESNFHKCPTATPPFGPTSVLVPIAGVYRTTIRPQHRAKA